MNLTHHFMNGDNVLWGAWPQQGPWAKLTVSQSMLAGKQTNLLVQSRLRTGLCPRFLFQIKYVHSTTLPHIFPVNQ
jgi:hypothetical protein